MKVRELIDLLDSYEAPDLEVVIDDVESMQAPVIDYDGRILSIWTPFQVRIDEEIKAEKRAGK
jgi:hypothetical protein